MPSSGMEMSVSSIPGIRGDSGTVLDNDLHLCLQRKEKRQAFNAGRVVGLLVVLL